MEFLFEGMGAGFTAIYIIYSLLGSAFGITVYVLRSLGLYSIAKRRGINNPWMSWVPVLDLWVLGCISDQYQYVVKGKIKNKRKWLLGLNIMMVVIYIALLVFAGIAVAGAIGGVTGGFGGKTMLSGLIGSVLILLLCLIPLVAAVVAVMVIRYIAMYDLYTSCSSQNNVLFLVLSIFFTVTEPFFVFFIRNKDEGMPPRRQQPQYIPPEQTREEM